MPELEREGRGRGCLWERERETCRMVRYGGGRGLVDGRGTREVCVRERCDGRQSHTHTHTHS